MEENKYEKPFTDEDEGGGFDFMEWLGYFIQHWYLFVIGVIIALGLAYLKNRSWMPSYKSAGTVMIEEFKASNSTQALMQGFGVQSGFKNVNNQLIMLGSYDLIAKVVDSLPYLKVDYISQGNFKTRNLYKASPIFIKPDYVAPEAYGIPFKIVLHANGSYTISVEDNKTYDNLKIEGKFGRPLQHNLFFITVHNTNGFNGDTQLYFKFRDRESLIGDFMPPRLAFRYVVEGSSVLEISLTSETPDRDIDFINKLAEIYLSDNLDKKNDVANKTIKFIDSQLGIVSKSLAISEGEMTNFRQSNKIMDVSTHSGELLGRASKYDEQESAMKLRETYFDYLTKYLKTNLAEGTIIAPASLGVNEPVLMALVQQINDLQIKRSELSPKNMYYVKYTKEMDNVKSSIAEVIKNIRASMDIEKADFNKRVAKINKELEALPEKEVQMISLERKYKMDDSYYTLFLQKRAEAEILKASNTPDNNILDKARVMAVTNGDTQSKAISMYLIFGLVIPALLVIAKEMLNNTVRSPKDVEKGSPFPLIGAVRHTNSTDPMVVAKNPRSAFTEMFRVIRTRIEFIVKRKSNIMMMITSTESGDGKTYFCINLAAVYGMVSHKTILVDMDIRKPSVNQRFNILQANGVSNYLINQSELDDIILKLPGVDFDILPGGTIPPNPGELIRSPKLVEMFEELRKRYDYIIVDTSPIGIVTDAYSLASQSDVNLFLVRNEKTNKGFYRRLVGQLKADKIQNMYTVMNDVTTEGRRYSRYNSYGYGSYAYGYSYGYSYGYGYGYTSKKRREAHAKYTKYYEDDTEM